MTNFIKMPPMGELKTESKKQTVFRIAVDHSYVKGIFIINTTIQPKDFKNVMFLWRDERYGDVFTCWNDDPNDRIISFGEAGDEFNQ